MDISKEPFGITPEGNHVDQFTLTNDHGLRAKIMTYGATIIAVKTPDRHGKSANITLALDSLDDYLKGHPYLGSTVGRYANRIARGRFKIGGVEYTLAVNNGPNHLHGGVKAFDKAVWKAEPIESAESVGVKFSHASPDGEEGYPGNLSVEVTYSLTNDDELRMQYCAVTDKTTVVNLTNHAYWNLTGCARDVLAHTLMLNASRYLPVDDGRIPLGDVMSVEGTPLDFTAPQAIGARIGELPGGYDHCYVLKKLGTELSLVARVSEPQSGRTMEVFSTEPGVQLYTANFLDGSLSGGGRTFSKHFGLCLETQHYPDSPNQPSFPSTLLAPGEKYEQLTVHRFGVA